jgi:hypothetical protein
MIRSYLNYSIVTKGARLGLRYFLYTPILAYTIVYAYKTISTTNTEIAHKIVLYLRLEELSNNAVVYNKVLLLLRIGRSYSP